MDVASKALLYLVIVLVAVILGVGLLVWFFKRDKFADFVKYAIGVGAGVAVAALVIILALKFDEIKHDPDVDMSIYGLLFYPILAEVVVAVAGGVVMLVCSIFSKKAVKIAGIVFALLLLGGFIAIMVEMAQYYKAVQGYYPGANLIGMIVSAVVFMVIIGIIYAFGDKRNVSDTRSIVYGAIAIAMAFALSYIRLFKLPQGGSVTLASLLPLMIYCCMFGTRRGTIVCVIYGLLQAVQDPWIIHPMQFLLDYPLAFGLVGVSGIFIEKGIFKDKTKIVGFIIGAIIAVIGRYACHTLSGVFAFADYANVDKYGTVVAYSMAYNSFALVDMVIAIAAGSLLFISKGFSAQMERSSDIKTKSSKDVEKPVDTSDEDDFFMDIVHSDGNKEGENANEPSENKLNDEGSD